MRPSGRAISIRRAQDKQRRRAGGAVYVFDFAEDAGDGAANVDESAADEIVDVHLVVW